MNPRSSRSTFRPANRYAGSAPIKINIELAGTRSTLFGVGTEDRNFFQVSVAVHFGDAGMRPQLNVGSLLDLVDQILRHGAGERFAAHQNDDAFCILGKIHGSLPGGIRAADHIDDLAFAGQGFRRAAAVIDSRTLQADRCPALPAAATARRVAIINAWQEISLPSASLMMR